MNPKVDGIQWLSSRKADAVVEKRARAVLKISGETFRKNRAKGEYATLDADQCPGIVELALIDSGEETLPVAKKTGSRKRSGSSR